MKDFNFIFLLTVERWVIFFVELVLYLKEINLIIKYLWKTCTQEEIFLKM